HEGHRRVVLDSTGHSDVAQQAYDWLQACLKTHGACRGVLQEPEYYPKRLLDLRLRRTRLILTASEPPRSHYATLSHCWGRVPFFRLTSSNEEELRRQVLANKLPRSFRDVILFTQRLSIRYLWIDNLCIMQEGPGHEEDWNEHAYLMGSIYQNGIVNISILHAESPYVGAYTKR
ncbi:uncharacterized protein K452DRAFT_202852, partial [Aplosporella prunicola CBS 121167]